MFGTVICYLAVRLLAGIRMKNGLRRNRNFCMVVTPLLHLHRSIPELDRELDQVFTLRYFYWPQIVYVRYLRNLKVEDMLLHKLCDAF
jgi:hypothetical protein